MRADVCLGWMRSKGSRSGAGSDSSFLSGIEERGRSSPLLLEWPGVDRIHRCGCRREEMSNFLSRGVRRKSCLY